MKEILTIILIVGIPSVACAYWRSKYLELFETTHRLIRESINRRQNASSKM